MCDINEININKYYKQLVCHGCLSSNRTLSALGEYVGIFQRICDYAVMTANMHICWECLAMLKKLERFQARVFKAQSLLYSQFEKKQYIQINSLSTLKVCPINQIIGIVYGKSDKEEKNDVYDIDKAEIYEGELKDTDIKLAEVKEEIEEYDNNEFYDPDIKEELIELVKQEVEPKDDKHTNSKKLYKFVFDIKNEEFTKKIKTDLEQIRSWYTRDRNSDLLKKFKFKCTECLYVWKSKQPLMKHARKFHSATAGPYTCDICLSYFKTKQAIIIHLKKHTIAWQCAVCGYKCASPSVMKSHLKNHKNEVQCLICDMRLENTTMFREHYRTMHGSFVCDHCGKRCFMKHIMERHMRNFHNFDSFECKHCKKRYKNAESLRKHTWLRHLVPTSAELAYCVSCDIHFDTQALYSHHLKTSAKHATERTESVFSKPKIPCPECTNVYARKVYMMNHYRHVHLKQTRYYCSLCDKYFLNNTRYLGHMKYIHEGGNKVKNKICTVCGRGFTEKRILINHMRTHTGERPFECPHCSSRFAQKTAMQTHVKNIHGLKKGKS